MAIQRTIKDFVRTQGRSLQSNKPSQLSPSIGQTNSYINSLKPKSIRNVSEIWGRGDEGYIPIVQSVPVPQVPYVVSGYVFANYVENTN